MISAEISEGRVIFVLFVVMFHVIIIYYVYLKILKMYFYLKKQVFLVVNIIF